MWVLTRGVFFMKKRYQFFSNYLPFEEIVALQLNKKKQKQTSASFTQGLFLLVLLKLMR
jgi:hypothetical protein